MAKKQRPKPEKPRYRPLEITNERTPQNQPTVSITVRQILHGNNR